MNKIIINGLAGAVLLLTGCATSTGEKPMTDTAPKALLDSVSAVGIGVTSLEVSKAFYGETLGMKTLTEFQLDYMNEIVLVHPKGSAVVLMEYIDGKERNVKNLPVKIVLRVTDPKALATKIRAAGYEIIREPEASEAVGGAVVGFARDPDGYLIELLQAQ